jgi:hypothetical protein
MSYTGVEKRFLDSVNVGFSRLQPGDRGEFLRDMYSTDWEPCEVVKVIRERKEKPLFGCRHYLGGRLILRMTHLDVWAEYELSIKTPSGEDRRLWYDTRFRKVA